MVGYLGSFVPLAPTSAARREGDARPALDALYEDRAAYLTKVDAALEELVSAGWVLPRDRERERAAALARWDWIRAR